MAFAGTGMVGDRKPDRGLLAQLRVVAVTPPELDPLRLPRLVEAAAAGGATAVMLRHPGLASPEQIGRGRVVAALARKLGFLFIFNGSPEDALEAGAQAVHLGSRTVKPREAVETAKGRLLIGYSVHHPFEDHAEEIEACSYITYSPVFPTTSKKGGGTPLGVEELARACRSIAIPVVALGGIGPEKAPLLLGSGCRCLAAISSIFGRSDPCEGAAALTRAFSSGRERRHGQD